MYWQALPQKTAHLLKKLARQDFRPPFYLSGGTALSLHLGHRESEDLDFFGPKEFDPLAVQRQLEGLGPLREVEISPGTLNLFLEGVKLQFLHYPYRLLEPTVSWQKVPISSVVDIACTKLQTVAMRGSKKDFIDLYFLLRNYPLAVLFQKMKSKYSNVDYSQTHILKSLVYFADADNQPMPKMHTLVSWPEVKKEITKLVKELKL